MDYFRAHYFITLSQCNSLKEAAQSLGISSAALSKSIKKLSDELGHPLTTNNGRGLLITDFGKKWAESMKPVLAEYEKSYHSKPDNSKALRIASFEVLTSYIIPHIISKGSSRFHQKIILHEKLPTALEQALHERKVDYGFNYTPMGLYPDLEYLKIGTIKMNVFGLAQFQNKNLKDLSFITPIANNSQNSRPKGLDGWPNNKHKRNVFYQVDLLQSALHLVNSGAGVAFLPNFLIKHIPYPHNIKVITINDIQLAKKVGQESLYLIKNKSTPENSYIKYMVKEIKQMIRL